MPTTTQDVEFFDKQRVAVKTDLPDATDHQVTHRAPLPRRPLWSTYARALPEKAFLQYEFSIV